MDCNEYTKQIYPLNHNHINICYVILLRLNIKWVFNFSMTKFEEL